MKKYILSAIAIVLVVATSAFIKSNQHEPSTVYYWYKVDANGTMPAGSQAFGTPETISFASSNLPCTPGSNAECIRGFNNPITLPSSAHGDTSPLLKQ